MEKTTYYTSILSIAMQCPFIGGPAVYVMRNIVAYFNDNIEYFDDDVCLQQGIYRKASTNDPLIKNEISLIPNPAKEKCTLIFGNAEIKQIIIKICDVLGKEIITLRGDIKNNRFEINTNQLKNGSYNIRIIQDKLISIKKLVILK